MLQLIKVRGGEDRKVSCAGVREAEPDDSVVGRIDASLNQSGQLGTVDETHDTVVPQQEVVGELADGRCAAGVPADREQQLILRGRDAGVEGLLFAPMQEASELVTERQEALIVRV
jgi:hypothetical protein